MVPHDAGFPAISLLIVYSVIVLPANNLMNSKWNVVGVQMLAYYAC
jgi:hypothetical protein